MRPHRGTTILILGILSLLCCGIFTGIPAWVMGNSDLRAMSAGQMDPAGEGTTKAGKICGIIGTVIFIIGVVVQIILMATGAAAGLLGN